MKRGDPLFFYISRYIPYEIPYDCPQVLDWHMANLEYANAGLLASLSLGQWDQDDPWEMSGAHVLLPGANSRLVLAMAAGVPIFYDAVATRVEHGPGGVAVHCANGRVFEADAALATLPLGVLKSRAVAFAPELPPRKLARAAPRKLPCSITRIVPHARRCTPTLRP